MITIYTEGVGNLDDSGKYRRIILKQRGGGVVSEWNRGGGGVVNMVIRKSEKGGILRRKGEAEETRGKEK